MNATKPNVMLLVVDSLRVDHLSCYGYPERTTPNIDRLSASSIKFNKAISPSGWTLPVFASILTGTYPSRNAVGQNLVNLPTIMEVLRTGGYKSFVVTDNFFVEPLCNQSDDLVYITPEHIRRMARSGGALTLAGALTSALRHKSLQKLRSFIPNHLKTALAKNWTDKQRGRGPWFTMIHYDVHWPYEPPTTFLDRFLHSSKLEVDRVRGDVYELISAPNLAGKLDALNSLYDAQVAWVDACIGDLLDHFRAHESLDDTLVIVTSDHGDLLGEHGLLHHEFVLYDPLIRVPFIVQFPNGLRKGTKYSGLVQTIDILPTLIDYLSIPRVKAYEMIQGKSLLKLMNNTDQREFTISERADWASTTSRKKLDNLEASYPGFGWRKYAHELVALRTDDYKYIWSSEGRDEMYELTHDPSETSNLISTNSEKAQELREKLDSWKSSFARVQAEDKEFDSTITKRLRALGYL